MASVSKLRPLPLSVCRTNTIPQRFLLTAHFFSRKLKKLFRKLKDETEPGETDSAHSKHPEQWDLDYSLEPYTGLTPEYMEMSKTQRSVLPRGAGSGKGREEVRERFREMSGAASASS